MHRKRISINCGMAVVVAALLWAAPPAWGKRPRPEQSDELQVRMLLARSSQPRVQFVPLAILEKNHGQGVMLEGDYNYLQRRIDALKDPKVAARLYPSGVAPLCGKTYESNGSESEGPDRQTEADNAEFLADLANRDLVVTGQVTEIVPGWNPQRGWVARAVYVKVEEVLKGKKASLHLDEQDRLPVLLSGGRIELEGVTLCDEPSPFGYHSEVGDRVLVTGFGCATKSCFDLREMFQLEGDEVWFHGSERTDDQPLKLERLVDRLGKD